MGFSLIFTYALKPDSMDTLTKNRIHNNLTNYTFQSGFNFTDLPAADRTELLARAKTIHLRRKEILFREGEPPKAVYIIQKGKIKVSQLNHDGGIQILFIHSVSDFFGHRSIIGNDRQPVTATALEDCELLCIEKEDFTQAMKNSAELTDWLLKTMSHEYTVLVNRINIFAQRGIKERLALFLLILNETYRQPGQIDEESEIHMNRNDLAAYTGTSVENLVRTLKTFRESGYVHVLGKSIFIKNFEALFTISGN